MNGSTGQGTFTGYAAVGPEGNETAMGSDFAIWMLSGMTPMPDYKTILGVFPAVDESTGEDLYSTMVQMEVVDPYSVFPGSNPPCSRLANGRLFYPNEVSYGKFALFAESFGYLYLFGADITGIKLARTPVGYATLADRNVYEYYNAATSQWQPQQLLEKDDPTGNILTWSYYNFAGQQIGPSLGDVWYDNYHQTMVMLWGDTGIDGTIWFSYAIDDAIVGPWSTPVPLWTPPILPECQAQPSFGTIKLMLIQDGTLVERRF